MVAILTQVETLLSFHLQGPIKNPKLILVKLFEYFTLLKIFITILANCSMLIKTKNDYTSVSLIDIDLKLGVG